MTFSSISASAIRNDDGHDATSKPSVGAAAAADGAAGGSAQAPAS
jgi:hypothetical protein